jgi:hypothetical protein
VNTREAFGLLAVLPEDGRDLYSLQLAGRARVRLAYVPRAENPYVRQSRLLKTLSR